MSYNLRNRTVIHTQQIRNNNLSIPNLQMANNNDQVVQDVVQQLQQVQQLAIRPILGNLPPPSSFSAKPGEDPAHFINDSLAWCDMNGQREAADLSNLLQLILKGPAYNWFNTVAAEVKQDRQRLVAAFRERFVDNAPPTRWLQEQQLLSRQMLPEERLEDYIFDIDNLCSILNKNDNDRVACFVRGLKPALKPSVIQRQPATWRDAVQAARLAAISFSAAETPSNATSFPSAVSTLSTPHASMGQPSHYQPQHMPFTAFNATQSSQYPSFNAVPSASHEILASQHATSYSPAYCVVPSTQLLASSSPSLRYSSTPHFDIATPSAENNAIHTLVNTVGELAQSVKQLQQLQLTKDNGDNHIAGISSRQSGDRYGDNNIICQLCGGTHHARTCYQFRNTRRNNTQRRNNPDAHVTCFNCSIKGHRAANCRRNQNNTNAQNTYLNN